MVRGFTLTVTHCKLSILAMQSSKHFLLTQFNLKAIAHQDVRQFLLFDTIHFWLRRILLTVRVFPLFSEP